MTILKISYITVRNLHCTAKLIKKVYCQFTTILRLFWCQCCILRFDSVAVDCKESHSGVLCIPHEWYNQLQKYLRHCTIFWINCLWPCTCDPPLVEVASNKRPRSKLEDQLWMDKRREASIILHRSVTSRDLKPKKAVFCWRVSTFLQLVVANSEAVRLRNKGINLMKQIKNLSKFQ